MRRTRILGLALALLAGAVYAVDAPALYQQHCAACHGADGTGVPGVFPPLVENPRVTNPDYVARVIREGLSGPLTVGSTTYNGQMPPFPQLADDEVRALARYVASGLKADGAPAPPAPARQVKGDPERGKAYYLGQLRFKNGGPPCVACHNARNLGALGGGTLGPDLSDAGEKFGPSLTRLIEKPGFRVMRSLYEDKPLTPEEAADVAAFLSKGEGPATPTSQAGTLFFGLGGLGAVILFLILVPIWPRQKGTYRDHLLRRKP